MVGGGSDIRETLERDREMTVLPQRAKVKKQNKTQTEICD